MNNNRWIILAIVGVLMAIGLRIVMIRDAEREKFIEACSQHGVFVIEKACASMGIMDEFEKRKPALQEQYTQYCDCIAGVWKNLGRRLRPGFFIELQGDQKLRSQQTRELVAWIAQPSTKSEYARCQNSVAMNLNWIAKAHANRKQK